MKRYVVFENRIGSHSWTIAHRVSREKDRQDRFGTFTIPAMYPDRTAAELFVLENYPGELNMEAYIADVDCPDRPYAPGEREAINEEINIHRQRLKTDPDYAAAHARKMDDLRNRHRIE